MVVISRLTSIMKSMLKMIAIQSGLVAAIGLSVQSQEHGRHYRIIKNVRFKVKEDMMDLDGLKNLFKVTEWGVACKCNLEVETEILNGVGVTGSKI